LLRRRTDVDHSALSAFGTPEDLRRLIDRFIEAGVTKFAVRPACPPELMLDQLKMLGWEVIPAYHGTRTSV
jgi:hypothetical protein